MKIRLMTNYDKFKNIMAIIAENGKKSVEAQHITPKSAAQKNLVAKAEKEISRDVYIKPQEGIK